MSAINTALPRISAATAIDSVDNGSKCEPLAISTRINVTICSATKKKIVGGRIAKNSSFSFLSILCMAFLCSVQLVQHEIDPGELPNRIVTRKRRTDLSADGLFMAFLLLASLPLKQTLSFWIYFQHSNSSE